MKKITSIFLNYKGTFFSDVLKKYRVTAFGDFNSRSVLLAMTTFLFDKNPFSD